MGGARLSMTKERAVGMSSLSALCSARQPQASVRGKSPRASRAERRGADEYWGSLRSQEKVLGTEKERDEAGQGHEKTREKARGGEGETPEKGTEIKRERLRGKRLVKETLTQQGARLLFLHGTTHLHFGKFLVGVSPGISLCTQTRRSAHATQAGAADTHRQALRPHSALHPRLLGRRPPGHPGHRPRAGVSRRRRSAALRGQLQGARVTALSEALRSTRTHPPAPAEPPWGPRPCLPLYRRAHPSPPHQPAPQPIGRPVPAPVTAERR
ncbi:hypothetical protein NDU88_001425 [Pleurodeles waltl]|uniref:Uncharacterized protein n=1 Tax=Pleurodeles waltl TaxID=8319 RepID=A0AAV7KSW9_PLEWA|nr:hypothetical protein NDU88_001425 [Pleurodeles waltl]